MEFDKPDGYRIGWCNFGSIRIRGIMVDVIKSFMIIVIMVMCSKFLRQLSFGRSDSLALDITICAFLYNLMNAFLISPDIYYFFTHESVRCIVLFIFGFIISFVHRQNKKKCMKRIGDVIDAIKENGGYNIGNSSCLEIEPERVMEATILDNLPLLAQSSIDVWYSQFADAMFNKQLKRYYDSRHKGEDEIQKNKGRSFREGKKRVRSAFVDLVNNLPTVNGKLNRSKYEEDEFNIDNEDQIMGMIIFDAMMLMSVLVAVRVI